MKSGKETLHCLFFFFFFFLTRCTHFLFTAAMFFKMNQTREIMIYCGVRRSPPAPVVCFSRSTATKPCPSQGWVQGMLDHWLTYWIHIPLPRGLTAFPHSSKDGQVCLCASGPVSHLLVGAGDRYAGVSHGLLMVEERQKKSCQSRGAKWKLPGYVCKDLFRKVVCYLLSIY